MNIYKKIFFILICLIFVAVSYIYAPKDKIENPPETVSMKIEIPGSKYKLDVEDYEDYQYYSKTESDKQETWDYIRGCMKDKMPVLNLNKYDRINIGFYDENLKPIDSKYITNAIYSVKVIDKYKDIKEENLFESNGEGNLLKDENGYYFDATIFKDALPIKANKIANVEFKLSFMYDNCEEKQNRVSITSFDVVYKTK